MQLSSKLPPLIERNLLNGVIIALLTLLYGPVILHWCDGWVNKSISIEHEYFSHGLLGLPLAAYTFWMFRKRWRRLENQSHPLGAVLLILGSIFYFTGTTELVNLSFPIILTGLCLWLKGIPGFKLQGFPLLLILLATPTAVPYLITPYTLPLQKFIAGTAGFILIQGGIDVIVKGVYLSTGGKLVEVAPYCAGLKMLFTGLYVSLMILFWTDNLKSRKRTTLLLGGSVIISVTSNIVRNTILTYFHGTGKNGAFRWLHDSWGGDLYLAATLGLMIVLLNIIEKFDSDSVEV